jgi:hypothetical protein
VDSDLPDRAAAEFLTLSSFQVRDYRISLLGIKLFPYLVTYTPTARLEEL